MDQNNSLNWINSFQKFGIRLGLNRIKYIMNELGNPQEKYKIIHVAGSNGKGSVCNYLSSVLAESGYKVGKYTSPHLHDINERITINDKKISNKDFTIITKKIKNIVEKMINKYESPTYFEILTAISFQYFKEQKVDYAIVEVGLGGKYDATNIVKPIISIITNISLEHQNILGKKITQIAKQKAGIIKENTPIITAAKNKSLKIIKEVADEKKSPIYIINKKNWIRTNANLNFQEFKIKGMLKIYNIKTNLLGIYQGENITISIKTLENLKKIDPKINEKTIITGIEKTNNPGRMEIINKTPKIILDGAHNPKGIKLLVETLIKDFEYKKIIFILGILKDKNIKLMLKPIIQISDIIITTQSNNDRALESIKLKKMINKNNENIRVINKKRISEAIKYSQLIAKKEDIICITGSLFTVAEAREYFNKL